MISVGIPCMLKRRTSRRERQGVTLTWHMSMDQGCRSEMCTSILPFRDKTKTKLQFGPLLSISNFKQFYPRGSLKSQTWAALHRNWAKLLPIIQSALLACRWTEHIQSCYKLPSLHHLNVMWTSDIINKLCPGQWTRPYVDKDESARF